MVSWYFLDFFLIFFSSQFFSFILLYFFLNLFFLPDFNPIFPIFLYLFPIFFYYFPIFLTQKGGTLLDAIFPLNPLLLFFLLKGSVVEGEKKKI